MGEITLRQVEDTDLDLINSWLNKAYVLKWYEDAGDWMNEIRNRHGTFSFIRHYIALTNGEPVGFCQYYDCLDAKEDWYEVSDEGAVYSIDYLIGEEVFLGKGFGKAMACELERIICTETTAKRIIAQPEEENTASCRTLLSCGYRFDGDRQYYYKELG
ncbi:MAG: GNAT family N-acetyltransferase [Oscillospiraceae bacterium]|nr:GNAT family N-acetyltransferase [Oscillospiraceae bacterium]